MTLEERRTLQAMATRMLDSAEAIEHCVGATAEEHARIATAHMEMLYAVAQIAAMLIIQPVEPVGSEGRIVMPVINIEGGNGDYEVWLDTEGSRCDGTVIGVGATRFAAIDSAIIELIAQIIKLNEMQKGVPA